MLKARIFKQRTTDDHTAAYFLGELPEIDKIRATAVYVRQSQTGADDAHGESRKTQLALQDYAGRMRNNDREDGVRLYDEGAGKSGQKRIDQRPELNRMYSDIEAGLVSTIIVAREDRLFRDKHGEQVGLFTSLLERKGVIILIPPIGQNGSLKLYDLRKYEHLKAFKRKMEEAYEYLVAHVGYMHQCQAQKAGEGYFDGRNLPAGLVISRLVDKKDQKPLLYQPWADRMLWVFEQLHIYNWNIARVNREIELLHYLFPNPSEEESKLFLFKTPLTKVTGGFKPANSKTIGRWADNVALIGWWPTGTEDDVITGNHAAIIPKELFEEGYMKRHGYTLDGEPVPDMLLNERIQVRKTWDSLPQALFHGKLLYAEENGSGKVSVDFKGLDQPYYVATYKKDDHLLYRDIALSLECAAFDSIVVDRLETLARQDVNMAKVIEQSLEQIRLRQETNLVSIKDQLVHIDEEVASQTLKLVNIEATIQDEKIRANVASAITNRLNELGMQRGVLVEKKRKLNVINGPKEVREFYDLFDGHFKEAWALRSLEQRQKLFSLISQNITIQKLSPHWVQLRISWLSSLMPWEDVCFIWRQFPSRGTIFSKEELEIIRTYYPTCKSPAELMSLLPDRTWNGIKQQANLAGINRTFKMSKADIPLKACWTDIEAFEDEASAIEMIQEATQVCKAENKLSHGIWATSLVSNANCNADDFGSVVWATGNISIAKATTAVMFNQSTDAVAQWGSQIPGFASSMATMSEGKFVMAAGGWPIRLNGATIGGIGVSGGNASGRDDDIARAGLSVLEPAHYAPQPAYVQVRPAGVAQQPPVYMPSPHLQPSPLPASPERVPQGTVNLDMAEELNSQENPYGDGPASSDQYSENSGGRS